jgi:hypothetical protein
MKLISSKGAFVEWCALGMMPYSQRIHPRDVIKITKEVGLNTKFTVEGNELVIGLD